MHILASQIFIHPFTLSSVGARFNTYQYGLDDSDAHGWNVQSWGLINGTAGILDDEDFISRDSAFAYAQELSQRYQIEIDWFETRYSPSADDHHVPSHDAADHDDLRSAEN